MSYNYSGGEFNEHPRKQYAVVIYVPKQLERFVAPLRERFDPDYELVAAHISLVFPWETDMPLIDLSAVLADEISQLPPLTVDLDSVGDFYPDTPIIYWRVNANDILTRLHRQLYARLDLPLPFKEFIPHVTVAKEISPHRVMLVKDRIAAYVPRESFVVTAIDLLSPLADQRWASVRTFTLPTE